MTRVLISAAVYNVVWGAATILFPNVIFDLTGIARPIYPQIWQCVGMVVGVYGVAYLLAALDPIRYWPIVLVGLLGKIFGPIGFAASVWEGVFPASWGWMIMTNDLVWWWPFGRVLMRAYRAEESEEEIYSDSLRSALETARIQDGTSVVALSETSPVLLVLLRHFGCTFCRESLSDLAAVRTDLASNGTRLVLVHMVDDETAHRMFVRYDLEDADRVSDPRRRLYNALGLRRGTLRELFGLRVIRRAIGSGALKRHGIKMPEITTGGLNEDPTQMPGAFLIEHGEIIEAFRHIHAGDRPDYGALSRCEASNTRMRNELEQAAQVQKTLLPTSLPKVEGGKFAWSVQPIEELAGDTLNVVRLDEDHLALYVLDVSGHGVSSALLSVTLNHWLSPDRGQSELFTKGSDDGYRIVSTVEVAEKLNAQFPMESETGQYFTLLYGILDTRSFEFRYVIAGHPTPIHIPHGQAPEQLPGTGIPIGLIPGAEYKEHYVRLRSGDRLYLFSDGVFEAGDRDGNEFGVNTIKETLAGLRGQSLDDSVGGLLDRVRAWRKDAPYADDLSVLAFEVA